MRTFTILLTNCFVLFFLRNGFAQQNQGTSENGISGSSSVSSNPKNMLLLNPSVQIEATDAVNNMYNFKFEKAERDFRWTQFQYPEHPLPYFLLGLSEWWKIVPN